MKRNELFDEIHRISSMSSNFSPSGVSIGSPSGRSRSTSLLTTVHPSGRLKQLCSCYFHTNPGQLVGWLSLPSGTVPATFTQNQGNCEKHLLQSSQLFCPTRASVSGYPHRIFRGTVAPEVNLPSLESYLIVVENEHSRPCPEDMDSITRAKALNTSTMPLVPNLYFVNLSMDANQFGPVNRIPFGFSE